jgi:hypothetical protein
MVFFAQEAQLIVSNRSNSPLGWIVGFALLGLIFALLLSPTFEVRLNKRIISSALTAGFFLSLSLILGNAGGYFGGEQGAAVFCGLLSTITGGLGLFFLVMASARFALSQSEPGDRTPSA